MHELPSIPAQKLLCPRRVSNFPGKEPARLLTVYALDTIQLYITALACIYAFARHKPTKGAIATSRSWQHTERCRGTISLSKMAKSHMRLAALLLLGMCATAMAGKCFAGVVRRRQAVRQSKGTA
jgi:hypothetical protein